MNQQNIDFLSGEVREILGKPPSSATKWVFGITLFSLALMLFAGFKFKYPEVIGGKMFLSTAQPPKVIDAPRTGELQVVKVKEGDFVSKNQLLAIFENDADIDDVLELENDLNKLNTLDEKAIRAFIPNQSLDLDPQLEVQYQDFLSSFEYVPKEQGDQFDQDAINGIYSEIFQVKQSSNSLERSIQSLEEEIAALEISKNNMVDLYGANPSETEYSKKIFEINQEIKKRNSEIAIVKSEIEKNSEKTKGHNSKILLLKSNVQTGIQERIFQLGQNISSLRKSIASWKANNLVYATSDGQIFFYNNLELKKRYGKGEKLAAIVPVTDKTEYIGMVEIPVKGSGKVQNGQEVNLKFDRYPFHEFGQVKATVSKIYPLSKEETYTVEVKLDNGLITNQGKNLEYYQQMGGAAEIITDERLFVGRLYDKFLSIWR